MGIMTRLRQFSALTGAILFTAAIFSLEANATAPASPTGYSSATGFVGKHRSGKRLDPADLKNNEHAPNRVLVKYKTTVSYDTELLLGHTKSRDAKDSSLSKSERDRGFKRVRPLVPGFARAPSGQRGGMGEWRVIELEPGVNVARALDDLSADADVEWVQPDYKVSISAHPAVQNDTQFTELWGMNNTGQNITGGRASGIGVVDADIDAVEAWNTTHGLCNNIVVAVIDTGVDYKHEDLAANIWVNPGEIPGNSIDDDNNGYVDDIYGWDFISNEPSPMDDQGHGTHVSGTIGAVGNNGIGVAGVCWNAKIMALKFLDSTGSGYSSDASNAVLYAAKNGARISNNSWGGGGWDQQLYDAIAEAGKSTTKLPSGHLFIAAAGNTPWNSDIPANAIQPQGYELAHIISVGASNNIDDKAWFSTYGTDTVDLFAPGYDILSTVPRIGCSLCSSTGYSYLAGTSMATPHVVGAAALIAGQFPAMTATQIKARLLASVDKPVKLADVSLTGGRLNVNNALTCSSTTPIVALGVPNDFVVYQGELGLKIKAFVYNCNQYLTGANITVTFNNGESPVTLFDDGQHQDEQAGDGVYGVIWQPTLIDGVTLTATVTHAAGSATLTRSGTVKRRFYRYQEIPYNWIDPLVGGTSHVITADQNKTVPIGFSFPFYGINKTQITISPHGYLTFGTVTTSPCAGIFCPAAPFPNLSQPNSLIAPFYHGLSPQSDTLIYTQLRGTAPNRQFVVTWSNTHTQAEFLVFGPMTFQAVLNEGSSDIYFQYKSINYMESYRNAGADAIVGVEDSYGLDGTMYLYNANVSFDVPMKVLKDNLAVRLYPVGTVGVNQPPIARITAPSGVYVSNAASFSASTSSDPENKPLQYLWDFGDGTTAIGKVVTHTYASTTTRTVTLVVYDGTFYSTPATLSVTPVVGTGAITVQSVVAPATVQTGTTFNVALTAVNNSAVLASETFYIQLFDSAKGQLANGNLSYTSPILEPTKSSTSQVATTIPTNFGPGTYYLRAIGLSSGSNVFSAAITVSSGADLTISAIRAPIKITAGTSVRVSFDLTNTGAGRVDFDPFLSNITTRIYLSTSSTALVNAINLGDFGGSVGPQTTAPLWGTVTIPTGLASGTRYWIAVADINNVSKEINESNNQLIGSAVTVGATNTRPVASFTAPATASVGYEFTLDASASSDVDGDPIQIYNWSATGGWAINNGPKLQPLTIGAPGTYTVTLIVNDGIQDSLPVTRQIVVDYGVNPGVTGLTTSASSVPLGGTLLANFNLTNSGVVPFTGMAYYIDIMKNPSDEASVVYTSYLNLDYGTFAAGSSRAIEKPVAFNFSNALSPGTYYVRIRLLPGSECSGCSTNNVAVSPLVTVTNSADLTVSALTIPSPTLAVGGSLGINATILNSGTSQVASYAGRFGVYVSTNSDVTTADTLVYSAGFTALKAGDAAGITQPISLNNTTLLAGNYFVGVIADDLGVVAETNDSNNTSIAVPITLVAPNIDFVVKDVEVIIGGAPVGGTAFDPVGNAPVGGTFVIQSTIANNGTSQMPAFPYSVMVRTYLSAGNNVLDGSDTLLETWFSSALTSGSGVTDTHSYTLTLPKTQAPGVYYVISVVDADALWSEASEVNNQGAVSLTIVTPNPDLMILDVTTSASSVVAGTSFEITAVTKNQGTTATTAGLSTGIFMSSAFALTPSDRLLATEYIAGLVPNEIKASKLLAYVGPETAAGCYFVGAYADYANNNAESCASCETNNFYTARQISVGGAACAAPPVVTFTASPTTVAPGGSSTLTWSTTGATSCTASAIPSASGWVGTKTLASTLAVTVPMTTTYALTCIGAAGTTTQFAKVTTAAASSVYTLTATPSTVAPSGIVSVSWTTPSGTTNSSVDWIGLFAVGAPNTSYLAYQFTNAAVSGTFQFTMPATPGSYEFRYLLNNGYTSVKTSNTVIVGGDVTLPSVPTSPVATVISSSQINLSWTASTDNVGVTGYRVESCSLAGCTAFVQIGTPTTTSFSNTGLVASTSYSYRVRAIDAAGNLSGYSTVVSATTSAAADTTQPSVPTSPVATVISSSQINLSWTASTDNVGVTGYLVESCSLAGCTAFVQIGTPTTTSFSNTGLAASTSYSYRVRAIDAAGNLSGYSTVVSATTSAAADTTQPSVPTSPVATVISSSQINLSWTASTDNVGVTGYRVESCSLVGCTAFVQIGTPTTTSFSNTGLAASTSYSYRVRAIDAAGNLSGYSVVVSATTAVATADYTLTATPTTVAPSGIVSVSWTTPSGTTNSSVDWIGLFAVGAPNTTYLAYQFTNAAVTGTVQFTMPAGTGNYEFRYLLNNGFTSVKTSNTVIVGGETTPPSVPTSPVATVISSSQIDLSWTASTDNVGVTGYRVESCSLAGCTAFVQIGTPTTTSFNNTGLAASTSYSYRVRAVDAAGNLSGYSTVVSATTSAATGDTVWVEDAIPAGGAQVNDSEVWSWTSTNPVPYSGTLAHTSATLAGLHQHFFYSTTNTLSVGTGEKLFTYVYLDPANPPTEVMLQWYDGASWEHRAYWGANSINWGTDLTNARRYIGALPATGQWVRLEVPASVVGLEGVNVAGMAYVLFDGHATWDRSGKSAAGTDTTQPSVPTSPVATVISSSQINLSWTASTDNVGVTGYRVESCSLAGCTAFVQIGTPTTASFSNTGLTASTSYSYRVRAVDAAGNLSGYSAVVSATTSAAADTTQPSVPTSPVATIISSSQINLSWTASTDNVGVTGYRVESCSLAGCTAFVQIGTPTTTSFSNTGLVASTSYSYRVRAIDAAGNLSGYSTVVSATTSAATPPPTLTIVASPAKLTSGNNSALTWSATNATSCTASGAWSGSQPTSGSVVTTSTTATRTFTLQCTGAGGSVTASATVTLLSSSSTSDLVMSAVTHTQTSVARGSAINVSSTAKNIASASFTASSTIYAGVYLSTDMTCATTDIYLGRWTILSSSTSLAAGGTKISPSTTTYTVPSATAVGSYYVCVYADYSLARTERAEDNNWRISTSNAGKLTVN